MPPKISPLEQKAIEEQALDWALEKITQGMIADLQAKVGLPGCVEGSITANIKVQGHIRVVIPRWPDKYFRIRKSFTKSIALGPCECPSKLWAELSIPQIPFHCRVPTSGEATSTLFGLALKWRFYVEGTAGATLRYCLPKKLFSSLKTNLRGRLVEVAA